MTKTIFLKLYSNTLRATYFINIKVYYITFQYREGRIMDKWEKFMLFLNYETKLDNYLDTDSAVMLLSSSLVLYQRCTC